MITKLIKKIPVSLTMDFEGNKLQMVIRARKYIANELMRESHR